MSVPGFRCLYRVGARSVFGGLVAITCTEALAISVEKAEKK